MFGNLYKDGGRNNDGARAQDGVGLLTSILSRYAEVGSVHYWCEQHALKFTFMITDPKEALLETLSIHSIVKPAVEFFHQLESRKMRVFDITCRSEENACVITITRDVDSMTQREVGLIVELLKRNYPKQLVYDEMYLPEEEQIFQEDMISQMLYSIQSDNMDKNVVALREEGRVLVFKS